LAASASAITPPPGYQLETPPATAPTSGVTPPPGYTLESAESQPAPTTSSISADQPKTWIGKFSRWIENVDNDIKSGSDITGIGTLLKKMGAHGVYAGNSQAVGDFMASLPLGLLKASKGATEATPQALGGPKGQTFQGLEDMASGGLQALIMPGMFIAPEAGEVAAEGLAKGTGAVEDAAGTVARKTGTLKGMARGASAGNEAVVQESVAKAGLEPGTAAMPEVRTPARSATWAPKTTETIPERTMTVPGTAAEAAPTGTMHEPILQNSARTQVNDLLKEQGLQPVSATTDLRDVGDQASKQFYARSADGFAQVEKATGKNLNSWRSQLRDLYRQRAEAFDPDKEGAIIEKINDLEGQAEAAFAEARAKGVDVDQPLVDWKRSKSLSNWGETVRGSVEPLEKNGTFDPAKYAPKLEKLYRSDARYPGQYNPETRTLTESPTQLEQAFGKPRAEAMRDDAYAASETQKFLKNYQPAPGVPERTVKVPGTTIKNPALVTKTPASVTPAASATESQALYDLVRQNTGRRFGVGDEVTNWGKVYKSFDKLSPAERAAQFKDPSGVERTILSQARTQALRRVGAYAGAAGVAHVLGVDEYLARRILGVAAQ